MQSETDQIEEHEELPESKSSRKRTMHALHALGKSLLDFSSAELHDLDLPDNLLAALAEASNIKSNSALKRHLHYIGKLMREVDAEPIQAALERRRHQHGINTDAFHLIETLRDRLIAEGDSALADVRSQFPRAERQKLIKLARQARNEQQNKQAPRASRLLFRYLRDLHEEQQDSDTL